tara:strand:+ start:53 stop:247 length:195 start_codon:yes stop_codon:yes gene_type:complete
MKIKLISKDKPITSNWCFKKEGFCSTLLDKINSGVQVEVDKVPKSAWEYVEEIKKVKKVKKGDK